MSLETGVDTSHDVPEDIANPWSARSEASFSSAVKLKETRPAVRRRGSDGATRRSRNDHEPYRVAHSRARTLDGDVTSPTSSHPLASLSSRRSVKDLVAGFMSAHNTRPHMKRVLSDAEAPSGNEVGDASNGTAAIPTAKEEERVVIMHEVMSNDSLPGVALKYGVSLPDLRRWNHLWPSDPIHLRKILYIPLDHARHAKHFRTTFIDVDESVDPLNLDLSGNGDEARRTNGIIDADDTRELLTVIRVPMSQLSFFPPPPNPRARESKTISHHPRSHSGRSALPPMFIESSTGWPVSPSSPSVPHTSLGFSYSSRAQNRSLGGLFMSARNTFVERLSLDSTSATTSTQSDDQDWGHELEDVSATSPGEERAFAGAPHRHSKNYTRSRGAHIGGKLVADSDALELNPLLSSASSVEGKGRKSGDLATHPSVSNGGSAPQRDAPRHDPSDFIRTSPSVRTAQLEPSPIMQLPPIRRKPKQPGG